MSVHQESLDMARAVERKEKPPELEYNAVRNDSLTMFGAAIGGAVLGMLLTLLVLAIINGGTLNFSGGQRLTQLEANVGRINENVGAVNHNVGIVADQAKSIQSQLATVEGSLRQELNTNGKDITSLKQAVDTLDQTRQQFNVFITALNDALSKASQATGPAQTAP